MSEESHNVSALSAREVEPELDAIFELFCEERRRLIVGLVAVHPSGLTLDELATIIAILEPKRDHNKTAHTNDIRQKLKNHASKLSAHGIIEYDDSAVKPGPAFENMHQSVSDITIDWVHGQFGDEQQE
ncbi:MULTISPECIES: hypothetical protein [Haloferax]|uniref:DUF7344 domain-containing protein n=2 Tax=Haloferax TaxID=2251 RepID=A0A6G1Z7F3_9EURY|nr:MULTISPECIES: hypothetical protein [Haloferax]KAB1184792.1 hypothetical protein Hfx1149_17155 [Haloferax sp. CBA1149]MRW82423.1 hypothetical protein [Haloferax marinisediminis]